MFDSLIQNDVPGVYASAHGGHSSLKSKENYVSPESASTKAINKILGNSLNSEESSSFNDLVSVERSKVKQTINFIKNSDKENQNPLSAASLPDNPQMQRVPVNHFFPRGRAHSSPTNAWAE